MPPPAQRDVFTRSSLPGSGQAGESNTERVQIPSALLALLKGRLHRSSVSDKRPNSEMKQKSCCLERGTVTVTKKGCLSISIKQLQVKFVFRPVILFYTCSWVFLPLKKCLLCCLGWSFWETVSCYTELNAFYYAKADSAWAVTAWMWTAYQFKVCMITLCH